ncbi:hypothetical protein QJS66_13075 [Kocuria rhizophila]|nr:hypothetical protein QJS66_13075 [Kocuria rhizophila]
MTCCGRGAGVSSRRCCWRRGAAAAPGRLQVHPLEEFHGDVHSAPATQEISSDPSAGGRPVCFELAKRLINAWARRAWRTRCTASSSSRGGTCWASWTARNPRGRRGPDGRRGGSQDPSYRGGVRLVQKYLHDVTTWEALCRWRAAARDRALQAQQRGCRTKQSPPTRTWPSTTSTRGQPQARDPARQHALPARWAPRSSARTSSATPQPRDHRDHARDMVIGNPRHLQPHPGLLRGHDGRAVLRPASPSWTTPPPSAEG